MDLLEDQIRAAMAGRSATADTEAPDTGDAGDAGAEGTGSSSGPDDVPTGGAAGTAGEADDGSAQETPAQAKARDKAGRFAKGQRVPTNQSLPGAVGTTQPLPPKQVVAPGTPQAPVTPKFRPPQSIKQELHGKWDGLAPEWQEELVRREKDTARGFEELSAHRSFQQQWQAAWAPYEPMLRSFGQNPLEAISSALQTIYQAYNGPPHMRAAAMANLIRKGGIDIQALDSALAGEELPQERQQQQTFDPEKLLTMAEQRVMARLKAENEQAETEALVAEAKAFAGPLLEKLEPGEKAGPESLRAEMARQWNTGAYDTLQAAYDAACWLHPGTRKIMLQNQASEQAKATMASTQRARASGVSLKTHQSVAPEPTAKDDLESQIRAAFKVHRRA